MAEPVERLAITFFGHPCMTVRGHDGSIFVSLRDLCDLLVHRLLPAPAEQDDDEVALLLARGALNLFPLRAADRLFCREDFVIDGTNLRGGRARVGAAEPDVAAHDAALELILFGSRQN